MISFTEPFPYVNNEILRQELMRRYGRIQLALDGKQPLIPGTTANSTLRWNGSAWVENDSLVALGNGDVGIGTTTPLNNANFGTLTIQGPNGGVLELTDDGALAGRVFYQGGIGLFIATQDNTGIQFITNATQRAILDQNGNVGINALPPGARLHVRGSAATEDQPQLYLSSASSGEDAVLAMSSAGSGTVRLQYNKDLRLGVSTNPAVVNSAFSEQFRFTTNGRLGVNVTVPSFPLDVQGPIRLRGAGASSEGGEFHLYYVNASNRATWTSNSSGDAVLEVGGASPRAAFQINSAANNRAAFTGNGSENNIIYIDPDRSANTMSIWSNETARNFQIGLLNGSNTGNLDLWAAGSGQVRIVAGGSTKARFFSGGGLAVGSSSLTPGMTVESSGNIGIAGANSGYFLNVAGSTFGRGMLVDASGTVVEVRSNVANGNVVLSANSSEIVRARPNGAFKFNPRATPASPQKGDVYFDSTLNTLRFYNGSTWVSV